MILKTIYYLLLIATNIYGLYFIIVAIPVIFKKRHKKNIKEHFHYFEILIPARNEEHVIGNLINSLKKLNYDRSLYEITVVLNNSTDNTKEKVSSLGVNIYECKNKIKSKGDALKEVFASFDSREYIDAYIIFDADNVVDKEFLRHMNTSLNNGYQVAQGFRDTKNISDNWISSSYALYYYIQNYFFNKARSLINASSSINGTGFMIKKEVIDTYGFKTKTLTEDIEFAGLCALNNIKIDFVEEAITYDEQPTNFKVSWVQRKRWSRGCIECYKNYAFDLIKNMSKNKSCLDLLMLYFAPMVHVFTILILLLSLIINLTTGDYTSVISKQSIINSIIGSSIIYLAQVIICISVVILNKKQLKKYISGILLFPVFMITWLPINIIILFQKNVKWQHIPHSKDITIDEI